MRSAAEVWKYLATSAVTACAFLVFDAMTGDRVTRAEVVQLAGPYVQERELILHQLKVSGEQLNALQALMQDQIRQSAELRTEVKTLVEVLRENGRK